ncbi:hypothetical protein [Chitinophaga sp. 22620]|uniref:hypothetical protein n=1 Tax=Chitinophaga sp. 22620 TaxID=3453952 RepID=UPI003F8799E0
MSESIDTKVFVTNKSIVIEALEAVPVTSFKTLDVRGEVKIIPQEYEYLISNDVDNFKNFLTVIPNNWSGTDRRGNITEALNYWFNNGWEIHYRGQLTTNGETYIILRKPK